MAKRFSFCVIDSHQLAVIIRNHIENVLILDSRSFLEYNSSHVTNAVNVGCAKLMKRRLQQDKLSIQDFLCHNCHWNVDTDMDIIVYDQSTEDHSYLPPDSFMFVFLHKLLPIYKSVSILKGGFLAFQAGYPNFCENEASKFTPLTSVSQPCLPISDHGPTRVLPFLYLGSQQDALNREVLQNHNITYELNVSTNCPKPDFIQEGHFMRIPVIDNYSEKLLPYFSQAFQFLDKVRESGGCVLVHCWAGISRSATVAIAYVMKHLKMSSDEAYRYVKSKRATISPNFNFLGQLLEYENQLQSEKILKPKSEAQSGTFDKIEDTKDSFYHSSLTNNSNDIFDSCCKKTRSTNGYDSEEKKAFCSRINSFELRKNKKCDKSEGLGSRCASATSLKELNFTPCQASATVLERNRTNIKETALWYFSDTPMKDTNVPSSLSGQETHKFDKLECYNSSSILPLWPSRDATPLSSYQDSFDPKEFNRSDSTSTSGLGSEGSDLTDSWNEFHSSCERESDSMAEDEYSIVPTDDYNRRKMLAFDEASFYGKFTTPFLKDSNKSFFAGYSTNRYAGIPVNYDYQTNRLSQGFVNPHDYDDNDCHMDSKMNKCDGLYRARSCPGIISSDSTPTLMQASDHSIVPTLRNRTKKPKRTENRNRYSCSSLDYMDYSSLGLLTSCPNVETSGTDSDSHRIFRHSMIQVS